MIASRRCSKHPRNAKRQHDNTMQTPTPGLDAATPSVKLTEKDIARFWSKVDKNGPLPDQSNPHYEGLGQCWQWTGRLRDGYGQFDLIQSSSNAHRASWQIARGDIPHGMFILHQCDNRSCVNPEHLFVGTKLENALDRERKCRGNHPSGIHNGRHTQPHRTARGLRHGSRTRPERLARGDRNGARQHPEKLNRGEKVNTAKLTADLIPEIRRVYDSKELSRVELARKFGVSTHQIHMIGTRRNWKHVE